MPSRHHILAFVLLFALFFQCLRWFEDADKPGLYVHGRKVATIWLPTSAGPDSRQAAFDLARILEQLTGESWPIYELGTNRPASGLCLYAPEGVTLEATESGRWFAKTGGLHLFGHDDTDTAHAVYAWLEDYVGVHWFFPGAEGEFLPEASTRIDIHAYMQEVSLKPSFHSRSMSGLEGEEERRWFLRNRLRGRHRTHHNLWTLFPAEMRAANPSWFPAWMRHNNDLSQAYQPDFLEPELLAYTRNLLRGRLREYPDTRQFSLALNDSIGFVKNERSLKAAKQAGYFRGSPDFSPQYFSWVDQIARALTHEFPQMEWGALAYQWCLNAPPVDLHPSIIVYVADDRGQDYDSQWRKQSNQLISEWCRRAAKVGLYDYSESLNYFVPRIRFHAMADAMKKAHEHGVQAWHLGFYPSWALDGPKGWLAARLAWNCELSVPQLIEQWAECTGVGSAGKQWLAQAEAAWMQQEGPPAWLRWYRHPNQAYLYEEAQLERMRQTLSHLRGGRAAELLREGQQLLDMAWQLQRWQHEVILGDAGQIHYIRYLRNRLESLAMKKRRDLPRPYRQENTRFLLQSEARWTGLDRARDIDYPGDPYLTELERTVLLGERTLVEARNFRQETVEARHKQPLATQTSDKLARMVLKSRAGEHGYYRIIPGEGLNIAGQQAFDSQFELKPGLEGDYLATLHFAEGIPPWVRLEFGVEQVEERTKRQVVAPSGEGPFRLALPFRAGPKHKPVLYLRIRNQGPEDRIVLERFAYYAMKKADPLPDEALH